MISLFLVVAIAAIANFTVAFVWVMELASGINIYTFQSVQLLNDGQMMVYSKLMFIKY